MSNQPASVVRFPSRDLQSLGLFTPAQIAAKAEHARPYLVEGLLFDGSINMAAGTNTIGKTPLVLGLAVAVAADRPWLNRAVSPGPVIYCDAETPALRFNTMLQDLSRHAGLEAPPPDLYTLSMSWSVPADGMNLYERLKRLVALVRPKLVVIDPWRVHFPKAETKSEETMTVLEFMRGCLRDYGTSWIVLHHLRKPDRTGQAPKLEDDPHEWLREVSGSIALANHCDARIGIDLTSAAGADLVIGGLLRGYGPIPPVLLKRVFSEDGDPQGYEALTGKGRLTASDRKAYDDLATAGIRFKDVKRVLGGNSDSKANAFIERCASLQILKAVGEAGTRRRTYEKVGEGAEAYRQVE